MRRRLRHLYVVFCVKVTEYLKLEGVAVQKRTPHIGVN